MIAFRSFLGRMFAMPSYPPDERDLRTFRLAGLELPIRATVAVVAVILIVIFDFQRTLDPARPRRLRPEPGHHAADRDQPAWCCSSSSRSRSSSSGSATGRHATGSGSATGAGASVWPWRAAS